MDMELPTGQGGTRAADAPPPLDPPLYVVAPVPSTCGSWVGLFVHDGSNNYKCSLADTTIQECVQINRRLTVGALAFKK